MLREGLFMKSAAVPPEDHVLRGEGLARRPVWRDVRRSPRFRKVYRAVHNSVLCAFVLLTTPSGMVFALTPLTDGQMEEVNGKGLAFAFDDFRYQMAPTSYFQQIGGATNAATTTFRRGDYRWVGTTISNGQDFNQTSNPDFNGAAGNTGALYGFRDYVDGAGNPQSPVSSSCSTAQVGPLGCPIAAGGAQGYAEVNNPLVLRVRDYDAVGRSGAGWAAGVTNTVLELVGVTASEPFRWSFWGEVDALQNNGTRVGMLQNQNIIIGAPVSRFKPDVVGVQAGPVFRMYKNQGQSGRPQEENGTLGMLYHHRLSGDYRFSVNQTGATTDNTNGRAGNTAVAGQVPNFTSREGMYFTHVNAFLPMGQLHYQAMVLNGFPDGNFALELTRIPESAAAYNDFYSAGGATGYERTGRPDRYYETHGYARWGDRFPGAPGGTSGIRFLGADPDGPTRNLTNTAAFPGCGSSQFAGVPGVGTSNGFNSTTGACNSRQNVNVGNVVFGATNSEETLLSQGGMVFLSRSGGTWALRNNPARAANNTLNMVWIQRGGDSGNGYTYSLERDARYPGNYNPTLNVSGINLGSSRVEGMLIQRLSIKTLGAAN